MKSRNQSEGSHVDMISLLKQRRGQEAADKLCDSILRRRDHIAELIKRGIGEIYLREIEKV